jgi:hypothetical protein
MARKEQGITTAEFFEALCESNGDADPTSKGVFIDSEGFVSGLIKMQIGIPPDEIAAVYSHVDIAGNDRVTLPIFMKFAEPPASSASAIITEKLRLRCQQMHRSGTPVMLPFQRADGANSGKVTRLQVRACERSERERRRKLTRRTAVQGLPPRDGLRPRGRRLPQGGRRRALEHQEAQEGLRRRH